ncbi:peptidoglycan-binding protein [Rhodobacteraceae bacterium B1Z28]|uniref:Peptidoglycan-binding protein n=1 Tax=Ruegeria haliotis TaxID=2747601 RepID=A0ABX2PVP4_9RHOB|nr:peptidoglycan-binding domain-containing protein [Ruegeria haliotis]NVO58196.1 peptidoglycan-binding protein [Ruegeria haliotis]
MKKQSIATIVAASLAASVPITAAADTKDLLIGGVVGALIHKGITDNQKAKKQQSVVTQKPSSGTGVKSPASLNSQYTRAERIQIQSAFRDLGYNIGTVDGVLGKNSRVVISQYQSSLGSPQTGQLTRSQFVTLLSQVPGSTPVFARRELTRDEVRMLQQGLQTLGYYHGGIDGSNGPGTRGATNTFLAQQGMNPSTTTPVQGLVMARTAAGLQSPPYLYQEANGQNAIAQPQLQAGFGTQPQQANPFGAPAAQGFAPQNQQPQPNPVFGAPASQQPVQAFGAPVQQQPAAGQGSFVAAPATPQPVFGAPQQQQPTTSTPIFGAPQQQQTVTPQVTAPANTQQNLFAPAAPQQQAPQPSAPQGSGGQTTTLFAAGGGAATPAPQQQAPQSSLDIFLGTAQPQPAQPPGQIAGQTLPATTGGDLFNTPATLAVTSTVGN